MSKYLIDVLTKSTKYITGYTPNTKFGLRPATGGLAKDHDGKNYHIGADYNTPEGTKLYAPTNGYFIVTNRDGVGNGYGNYINFYMEPFDLTLNLSHLLDIAHLEGKQIKAGEYIGATGKTGIGSGPHLHLGLAKGKKTNLGKGKYGDGTWINPAGFIVDIPEPAKPVEPAKPAKDVAVIQEGAVYKSLSATYNNKPVPKSVIGKEYSYKLNEVKGQDWVYFPDLESYVAAKDVKIGGKAAPVAPTPVAKIKVGDMVLVKKGAKSYTGGGVYSGWYTTPKRVDELKGDRAVLDIKGWYTPFNIKDLIKQ